MYDISLHCIKLLEVWELINILKRDSKPISTYFKIFLFKIEFFAYFHFVAGQSTTEEKSSGNLLQPIVIVISPRTFMKI